MNRSKEERCLDSMPVGYDPAHLKGFYITVELLIALLAIVGNLLVCLAVTRNRKLRTVTNYFLVSLSVADILVGVLAIPCAIMTDLGQPRHDLPTCLALLSILMVLTQSSILSLLAVAAERYVAILLPFQYQRIMSPRNARLCLGLTWTLAMITGSVPLMDQHRLPPDAEYCIFTCVVDMYYLVYFNFFCCLLLPLVVMFVIYGRIFATVRRHLRRIAAAGGSIAAGGVGETGGETGDGGGGEGTWTGGTATPETGARAGDGGGTRRGSGAEARGSGAETRGRSVSKSVVELVSLSGIFSGAWVGDGTEGDGVKVAFEGGVGVRAKVGVRSEAWVVDVGADGDGATVVSEGGVRVRACVGEGVVRDGARAGSDGGVGVRGGVGFRDGALVGERAVGDGVRVGFEGEGEVGESIVGDGVRIGFEGEGGVRGGVGFRDVVWVGEGPVGGKKRVRVGVGAETRDGVTESTTGAGAEVGCSIGATRAVIHTKTSTWFRTKSGTRTGSAGCSASSSSSDSIIGTLSGLTGQAKQTRREVHKATSLFLVLFLFMVCWIPIHCVNTVVLFCPQCPVPMPVSLAAILLSHANSALNPILYAYRMRSFRDTLRGMCHWRVRPKRQ